MPRLNSVRAKQRIAELDLRTRAVADHSGIPYGSLRNALAGRDQIRMGRVYALARVLRMSVEDLVADGRNDNEGVPSEPPVQPQKDPTHPAKRQDTEHTTAPGRIRDASAA